MLVTFENIILILQTVGPFTVLITVYFLVTELKEQNRVARANARQNIADSHQKVATCPDTSNSEAKQIMLQNQIRHLPVFSGEHLVGIISMRDVFKS